VYKKYMDPFDISMSHGSKGAMLYACLVCHYVVVGILWFLMLLIGRWPIF
jgi:hypothetical protein